MNLNTPISPTGDVTVLHLAIALTIVAIAFVGFFVARNRDRKTLNAA